MVFVCAVVAQARRSLWKPQWQLCALPADHEDSTTDPTPLFGAPSVSDALVSTGFVRGQRLGRGRVDLTDGTLTATINPSKTPRIEKVSSPSAGLHAGGSGTARPTLGGGGAVRHHSGNRIHGRGPHQHERESHVQPVGRTFNLWSTPAWQDLNGSIVVDLIPDCRPGLTDQPRGELHARQSLLVFSEAGTVAT